jgi:glycosyltransferase involved in cell wall biosynthesis
MSRTCPDTRPRRLAYVLPGLGTGGTERLVTDLARRLDRDRFAVSVVALEDGRFRGELERDGCRVTVIDGFGGGKGRLGRLGHIWGAMRHALRGDVDLVHTHHLGMLLHAGVASLPRRRWRWVHTEHIRPDVERIYSRRLVRMAPMLLRWPDLVTGVAEPVGRYFREEAGVEPRRVRVILNGVDVPRFAEGGDRQATRRSLGLADESWVIGTIATLRAQKNHGLLLDAFARVARAVPSARLVLAGDGPLAKVLEARSHALGVREKVHFLGSRLDAPALLGAFDTYCLPSHYEGLPLTILEAMAAGCPIVATRVLGIAEVVRDGDTGVLVAPDDAAALAAALLRLRATPALAARLAEGGRAWVRRHGDVGVMTKEYERLYDEILAGGPTVGTAPATGHPMTRSA